MRLQMKDGAARCTDLDFYPKTQASLTHQAANFYKSQALSLEVYIDELTSSSQ